MVPTDDAAAEFAELRPALLGLAYRMLGSMADAEDVVQDAYLRWSKVDTSSVDSARAYLTTTVTRLCIDQSTSARARRESYPGVWLPEPVPVEDADPATATEMADSLSLAFLVLLEELQPTARAVFLLHDVFGYGFDEVAGMTGASPANCRQLASRARRQVAERRRRFDADRRRSDELARHFLAACATGDMEALLAMLAEDVVVWGDSGGKGRANPRPVVGARRAARFLVNVAKRVSASATVEHVRLNGQPGLTITEGGRVTNALVLDVIDGRISGVRVVVNPDKLGAVQPGARRLPALP